MDKCLCFHLDNLDLITSITSCHIDNLLRFVSIGKPRYLKGVDPTLQLRVSTTYSDKLCDIFNLTRRLYGN